MWRVDLNDVLTLPKSNQTGFSGRYNHWLPIRKVQYKSRRSIVASKLNINRKKIAYNSDFGFRIPVEICRHSLLNGGYLAA